MANISETLQLLAISAGGPGSGRHPGAEQFRKDIDKIRQAKRDKEEKEASKRKPKSASEIPAHKETHKWLSKSGWNFSHTDDKGNSLYTPKANKVANYNMLTRPDGSYDAVHKLTGKVLK